ncbi:MAG: hypothetical protein ACI9ON_003930 [Limisphaerales bacterium]|jgi:hypothetical protein
MDWGAIGAIAESLGAIGVIASLIYVGGQIKQNTRATRATSAREAVYRYADWNKEIAANPEFAKLCDVSLQEQLPDFTDLEWNRISAFVKSLFHIYEAQYINAKFDVGIGDQDEPQLRTARWVIETFPVFRKFWEEVRHTGFWTEGFEDAVESIAPARSGGVTPVSESSYQKRN